MKNIELQQSLIRKILDTDDNKLLRFILGLLNKESDPALYSTTGFEKKIITESIAEYLSGKTSSNEEVHTTTTKWLEE